MAERLPTLGVGAHLWGQLHKGVFQPTLLATEWGEWSARFRA